MLYATIRGEYLECSKDSCRWATLGGGAAGNYEKYFKKLSGLLNSLNQLSKHFIGEILRQWVKSSENAEGKI